jgi:hypothetical protein
LWCYGRRRYISHKVEAKKQVLRKLGTQGAWGASGATGYCSEAVAAFVGTWNAGEEEPSVERVLGRVAEDLREKPVVLPSGEEVRFTFSGVYTGGGLATRCRRCSRGRTMHSTGPRSREGAS